MQIVEAVRLLGTDGPQDARRETSAACVYEYLRVLGKVLVGEGNLHSQDLEDAVGDALMNCLRSACGFKGKCDPEAKAWLMAIIRNASKDLYKAKNRSQRIERQVLHVDFHEWEESYASAGTVGGISAVPDYVLRTELRDPGKTEKAKLKKRKQRSRAHAKRLIESLFAQVRTGLRIPKPEEVCAALERVVSSVAKLNQIGVSKEGIWSLIPIQARGPSWLGIWTLMDKLDQAT